MEGISQPSDQTEGCASCNSLKLSTETRAILAINTTDLETGVNVIDEADEDNAN